VTIGQPLKNNLTKDNSGSGFDSGPSIQGNSNPLVGRRNSRKKSEIISMINETKTLQDENAQ